MKPIRTIMGPTPNFMLPRSEEAAVEWHVSDGITPYEAAIRDMEVRVDAIHNACAKERVWMVEHPPLYTAGTSAKIEDLRAPDRFPVHTTGRGGQYTYHGPGQRVVYVMLNLKRRRADIRAFVFALEEWIIHMLANFDLYGERRNDRVGIWIKRSDDRLLHTGLSHTGLSHTGKTDEYKIASIGIRLRKWISFHGISINIAPDLEHFSGIVPCGIKDYGVTSFAELGCLVSMSKIDAMLRKEFEKIFGRTEIV